MRIAAVAVALCERTVAQYGASEREPITCHFTGEFLEFWQRNPPVYRSVKDPTVSRLYRHVSPDTTSGKKRDFVLIRFGRSVSTLKVTEYSSVCIVRLTSAS